LPPPALVLEVPGVTIPPQPVRAMQPTKLSTLNEIGELNVFGPKGRIGMALGSARDEFCFA